jgi:3-isopropylmalate/(R)-2-methylmalate dehydratase small subunit
LEPFQRVEGVAAPLAAANVDTDVIMPKVFLKGVDRQGLDIGVFRDLRFTPEGHERADFILNQPPWRGASFLVVGPNFGCGSSREHAVWGLRQLGVRALVGSSFAGIFYDNCARNGLLALTLPIDRVQRLMAEVSEPQHNRMAIDLPAQTLTTDAGSIAFEIDPLLKALLVEGLDPVGWTLKDRALIARFEDEHFAAFPWLRPSGPENQAV